MQQEPRAPQSPIIVIGMHRSGTSMLTRMLEQLGVFVGEDRGEELRESLMMSQLNDWALRVGGARWDQPQGGGYLYHSAAIRALMAEYLKVRLRSPMAKRVFGVEGLREMRQHGTLRRPWGWKDPRNTYTLPLWLELFPHARVVHIHRHGVDVAQSLHTIWGPRDDLVEGVRAAFDRRRLLYHLRPMGGGYTFVGHASSLDACIAMWEDYTAQAHRHVEALGEQAIEVCYEDLLANPAPILTAVARCCGLDVSAEQIAEAAGQGRPERAYAFRRKPELVAFAAAQADRLAQHGYTPQGRAAGAATLFTPEHVAEAGRLRSAAQAAPASTEPTAPPRRRSLARPGPARRVAALTTLLVAVAVAGGFRAGEAIGSRGTGGSPSPATMRTARLLSARTFLYRTAINLTDRRYDRAHATLVKARQSLRLTEVRDTDLDAAQIERVRRAVQALRIRADVPPMVQRAAVLENARSLNRMLPHRFMDVDVR